MAVDGGWGWMVVLGSCLCHFFLIGINRSMGIVYVMLQERFEASATDTALAAAIFVSVRALGGNNILVSAWLTSLLQCFDAVGWVIRPVKTVGRITYIVLAQT